ALEPSSELETAMETLINVFHAHSGKEGDKYKLSKKELKELLQTELSGFLDDADAVDKVMKELDENGDGEVDFQEYVRFCGENAKHLRRDKALGVQKR
uniref:EF-hand domain-containing protein n=1 Tax=Sus scrofa TaxID=9823 RepID=A0A8D1PXV5_PIG